jgi:di/tricarboxylate transporter
MEMMIVLAILLAALILFVTELIPIDLTALLIMGALIATSILTPEEGVSGFSNPAPVTVAAVLVLSAGLIRTGAISKLGSRMARLGGASEVRLLAVLVPVVGLLSAFINNTAAVAMFLPLVLGIARERKISPSRLLMPLSFAGIFGGVVTYIGTSTNIIVGSIVERAGLERFRMFEFTRLGVLFLIMGTLYLLIVGRKLLPLRRPAESLTEGYHLQGYLTELVVQQGSPLIGKTLQESQLSQTLDIEVLEILRGDQRLWSLLQELRLQENDLLIVKGQLRNILKVREAEGLEIMAEVKLKDHDLESQDVGLAEAVISPGSSLDGLTLKQADFRKRYQATVLAIRRHGGQIREKLGNVRLHFGDTLLVQGRKERLQSLKQNPDFLLIMEDLTAPEFRKSKTPVAILTFLGVVAAAAFDLMPIMVAALFGALLMVLTRCITAQEAYEAVDWKIIMLIAGTLSLGLALEKTGAAELIANRLVLSVGPYGPVAVLSALYLLTSLMTEMMSNNASAALLTPIAISIAGGLGVSPRPFAFCIAFAASASFLSPIGYQTNTLVYGPGGYRFSDYIRVGGPLNLLNWIAATLLIPVFWPF